MQHRKLNLVAAFVVALGAFLLGKPSTAVAGSCTHSPRNGSFGS